jgi:ATP-dependent DNA helicase RecQ
MKLKITERNGALTISVLGMRQELIISEELGGGFELELRSREEPLSADLSVFNGEEIQPGELPVVDEDGIQPGELPVIEPEVALFGKLAALRREIALADSIAPYMVFHDKTLHEMVEKMPADLCTMRKVSGVGEAKLEKYGERFLAIINGAAA